MADKKAIKPVALAVGAALAGSFAISGVVNAADTTESPFSISNLEVGYMLGETEGRCGADKDKKKAEGSCGEKGAEGSCGEKGAEGSCGETGVEGDAEEKEGEGKCGEGSCGGSV